MELKKKIGLFILFIVSILNMYNMYIFSNNILQFCYSIVTALLLFAIVPKLYKEMEEKLKNVSNKTEIILYCLFLIFNCFIFILNKFSYIKLIGFMGLILTTSMIYQFTRREIGKQSAIFSLLLSTVVLSPLFYIINYDIRILSFPVTLLLLYIIEYFDYTSFFRKKNIARIFSLLMLILFASIINKYCLLILILFVLKFSKNRKLEFISWLLLLFICLTSMFISKNINVSKYFVVVKNNNGISFIVSSLIIIFNMLIFRTYKNYNKFDFNKDIYLVYILQALAIIIERNDIINLTQCIPLIIIYISINLHNLIFSNNNFKKYFVSDSMKNMKVSVVIPNYNYANYIEKRIDSVLKQNFPIYELIVLDDCSKDNSEKVILNKLEKVKKKYPNVIVKYFPNKKNSGNVFKQWEKCFDVSSGDYLWICEADDLCSKYFLNSVMYGFKDKKVVLSYAESLAIDENGKVFKKNLRDWIDIFQTGRWNSSYITTGTDELKKVMCINNTIANVSSVVFKKDSKIPFIEYLKQAENFTLAGDWYFYSKILLYGNIAYCADSLNYHRIHSNSVTNTTDNFVHFKEVKFIQDSIMNDVKVPKPIQNRISERDIRLQKDLCISNDEIYYDKVDLKKLIKDKNITDDILLSIIIPVYNVEKYIEKCLKSIFKDLPIKTEVIIINDGSPDNSEDIILRFKEKYNCIKYIKKENGGLSSVKNVGLSEAKGRYIIYLDSDDYVSSNMYNTMLKKAIDKDCDIVYSDVLMTYEDGSVRYCCMTNYEQTDELLQIIDGPLMAASWNKIVKKKLYDGLKFPEQFNNEDIAVSPILFLKSKKTLKVESPFYKYVQRSGSIQNSGFSEKRFAIFDTSKILFEQIKDYDYITRKKVEGAVVTHQILGLLLFVISKLPEDDRKKYVQMFCEKYNTLNVLNDNVYIYDYLKKYNIAGIENDIKANEVDVIIEKLEKI